ncbi:MAG TPA: TPM domain-containing protein, partial [bacterium]|nr:TPM domain-containing protein [bacterium]
MRNKFLFCAAALLLLGADFPSPKGYVNDFAELLGPESSGIIHNLSLELEQKSGAQFALATVKSLEGEAIENYAWNLFEKWGIGEKGKDTGVLLLVAPAERKVRIEVGYGFEGAI